MTRELDLAWLAGLLDGEGHLSFRRTIRLNRPNPLYQPTLKLGMYTLAPVERAARIMDTDVKSHRHYARHIWVAQLSGREKIRALLIELMPHLTGKRPEAELLLRAMEDCPPKRPEKGRYGLRPWTLEELALREGYYWVLRQVKKELLDAPMLRARGVTA